MAAKPFTEFRTLRSKLSKSLCLHCLGLFFFFFSLSLTFLPSYIRNTVCSSDIFSRSVCHLLFSCLSPFPPFGKTICPLLSSRAVGDRRQRLPTLSFKDSSSSDIVKTPWRAVRSPLSLSLDVIHR